MLRSAFVQASRPSDDGVEDTLWRVQPRSEIIAGLRENFSWINGVDYGIHETDGAYAGSTKDMQRFTHCTAP